MRIAHAHRQHAEERRESVCHQHSREAQTREIVGVHCRGDTRQKRGNGQVSEEILLTLPDQRHQDHDQRADHGHENFGQQPDVFVGCRDEVSEHAPALSMTQTRYARAGPISLGSLVWLRSAPTGAHLLSRWPA